MLSSHRIYPVVAVALLAAGSIWLERLTREPEVRAPVSDRTAPDFIAEQTRIVGFGKDGQPRFALVSDKLTHYPHTDITIVDQPRLELDSNGRTLEIRAERGEVSPGGERVDFAGQVEGRRQGGQGEAPMTFASEELSVWPDEHRAESDDAVKLTQGLTTAHADGLRADNLFGTLDLIGNAKVNIPRSKGSPQ